MKSIQYLALLLLMTAWFGLATPVSAQAQEDVQDETPVPVVEEPVPPPNLDSSPLEELNPAEASWEAWIGPIVIGVFAIVLVFLIRRFSRKRGGQGR